MDELLTTRETAARLGVGTSSVKRWADAGLLECVKTPGGHRRFPRAAVEAFAGQPAAPADTAARQSLGHWLEALLGAGGTGKTIAARLRSEHRRRGSWFEVADSIDPVLDLLGRAWARGDITVIEEHVASERLTRGLAEIAAELEARSRGDAGRCLLFTAESDEHDLGLRLAEICLRSRHWTTIWSGARTPLHFAEEHIAATPVDLVAVSASVSSRDSAFLADQAERLARICEQQDASLVLGGRGLWPERPRRGHRVRTFAELESVLACRP